MIVHLIGGPFDGRFLDVVDGTRNITVPILDAVPMTELDPDRIGPLPGYREGHYRLVHDSLGYFVWDDK